MVSEQQRQTMRADYAMLVADRQQHQQWTAQDARDLHLNIKSAVDCGDDAAAAAWALYLATEADALRARAETCRAAEARIRAECDAERERQERQAA
jgi:hypothetical protein